MVPFQEKNNEENRKFKALLPPIQMAGHTGYLTFATWPRQSPVSPPVDSSATANIEDCAK